MTYSDAPFTIDAGVPIGAEAPDCVSYNGAEADDLKAAADLFYAEAAGDLTFDVALAGQMATATVTGNDGPALVDWGDGFSDPVDSNGEATHQYGLGVYFAAVYADGYTVAATVDTIPVAEPTS